MNLFWFGAIAGAVTVMFFELVLVFLVVASSSLKGNGKNEK